MPLRKKVLLLHFEIENHKTIMDKIRIGITHGDLNGVGYEIILKAFADAELSNCCVPIVRPRCTRKRSGCSRFISNRRGLS